MAKKHNHLIYRLLCAYSYCYYSLYELWCKLFRKTGISCKAFSSWCRQSYQHIFWPEYKCFNSLSTNSGYSFFNVDRWLRQLLSTQNTGRGTAAYKNCEFFADCLVKGAGSHQRVCLLTSWRTVPACSHVELCLPEHTTTAARGNLQSVNPLSGITEFGKTHCFFSLQQPALRWYCKLECFSSVVYQAVKIHPNATLIFLAVMLMVGLNKVSAINITAWQLSSQSCLRNPTTEHFKLCTDYKNVMNKKTALISPWRTILAFLIYQ